MAKIKRCTVCGERLNLTKLNRYEVKVVPTGINVLTEKARTYECFDCEKCGCQNIVNIRREV